MTDRPAGSSEDAIRREFARQAAAFEDPTSAFGRSDVLSWIREHSPVAPNDVVLDVAAGTALVGRALAPQVAAVVAVDLTPEMLEEGKRAADEAGLGNIVFQEGDATRLAFQDRSFDRVVSRLAVHHFEDPMVPLREMARVCRRGGALTVIDMVVVVADQAVQTRFNQLERWRDPSHTRALTRAELLTSVSAVGEVVHSSVWENVLDGERWLEQTSTPNDAAGRIRSAWADELAGGPPTGMLPRMGAGGGVEFVHVWDLHVVKVS